MLSLVVNQSLYAIISGSTGIYVLYRLLPLDWSVIVFTVLVAEKEAEKAKERQAAEDSDDVDMADQEEPVEPKVEVKEVS